MNEWWWVVFLTEVNIKVYTQSTGQTSDCAKLFNLWEESKMDLLMLSCPCAYLIKHYTMKAYGGVDI
jgi:hypothetical protein